MEDLITRILLHSVVAGVISFSVFVVVATTTSAAAIWIFLAIAAICGVINYLLFDNYLRGL